MTRRYVLILADGSEENLTMAEAYALESSDYIKPAPELATEELWRYVAKAPNELNDVLYVLEDFRR